jgi:hypothetical protein
MALQELSAPVTAPLFRAAEAVQAPAPSSSQLLSRLTAAIPDVPTPGPQPAININDPQGKSAVRIPFPTAQTIFEALDKIGRRHLLQMGEAPAPAPAAGGLPGPAFPVLPNVASGDSQTESSGDTWYQTVQGDQPPGAATQAQPQPLPQAQPFAQPEAGAPVAGPEQSGIPGAQAPVPEPITPGPAVAFGPIPEDVKAFTVKLANFLGSEAKKAMPARIEILPGMGRKLTQAGPKLHAPLLPEPFAAEAPMTAPGACC